MCQRASDHFVYTRDWFYCTSHLRLMPALTPLPLTDLRAQQMILNEHLVLQDGSSHRACLMAAEPLLYHGLIISVPIPSEQNWVVHYLQQAGHWSLCA